ncbi:MAG: PEP-CTERM sorting domain-containing protein [Chthoniobacterales bacterium]
MNKQKRIGIRLSALVAACVAVMVMDTLNAQIYVTQTAGTSGTDSVRSYNLDGTLANANFITMPGTNADPYKLSLDGLGNLYVGSIGTLANGGARIAKYDATTGSVISGFGITGSGYTNFTAPGGIQSVGGIIYATSYNAHTAWRLDSTTGAFLDGASPWITMTGITAGVREHDIAISGGILYETNYNTSGTTGTIRRYDMTTGAQIGGDWISGLAGPLATVIDNGYLYVGITNANKIARYNLTTGLGGDFITTGLSAPEYMTIANGSLYVTNYSTTVGYVGQYDATTGATINDHLIQNLLGPIGIAVISTVPEPSSMALIGIAVIAFMTWEIRKRKSKKYLMVNR